MSELAVRLHRLVEALYPLPRSITGDGVRRTLDLLAADLPIDRTEVPSGTTVLDWHVPDEWVLREAWIEGPDGRRVVDVADHNLHVVGYSRAVDTTLDRASLDAHLHSLPDRPDLIPYRTSYWADAWGFCLPHRQRETLPDGEYRVRIDADLVPGSLTLGEVRVPGASDDVVLVSTHTCHPSLANDNCSGIAVAAELARRLLAADDLRLSYRIVFCPATIGAITWLAVRPEVVARVRHGVVLAGLGDPGPLTWKRSQRGNTAVDRAAAMVLPRRDPGARLLDFSPYGYDERQYCSPGFDLAVGRLSRQVHGTYPEYHTSADTPAFVDADRLADAADAAWDLLMALDADRTYRNLAPHGEPQLGRRGLYDTLGARPHPGDLQMAMLWVLNQSDGTRSLLDIAERSGLAPGDLADVAGILADHGLLEETRPMEDTR
jgi:aminopeptidase-like protein